jgi:hypothetical protein
MNKWVVIFSPVIVFLGLGVLVVFREQGWPIWLGFVALGVGLLGMTVIGESFTMAVGLFDWLGGAREREIAKLGDDQPRRVKIFGTTYHLDGSHIDGSTMTKSEYQRYHNEITYDEYTGKRIDLPVANTSYISYPDGQVGGRNYDWRDEQ